MSCKNTISPFRMLFEMCRLRIDHGSSGFRPVLELLSGSRWDSVDSVGIPIGLWFGIVFYIRDFKRG